MPIATALILIGSAAALGAILIVWGWRGRRVNLHPACRACGYDLSGLMERVQCPECGRDLRRRRAVGRGVRVRRSRMVIAGFILMTLAVIALWPAAQRVNWNRHAPVWWLTWRAENPSTASPAVRELLRRLSQDRLSESQVSEIAEIGLAFQADDVQPWLTDWVRLLSKRGTRT